MQLEKLPLEHISQELASGCMETMDESDMFATEDDLVLLALLMAATLAPTPPAIANNPKATFFKLIFIFVTLFLIWSSFAARILRSIPVRRLQS